MASKKKSDPTEDAPKKGGKGKIIAIVAVLGVGAGGYVYGSGQAPAADGAAATTTTIAPALKLGPMVDLPAVNLNLKDGHYLRVAVSLALATDVTAEEATTFNGAVAKDIVVNTLSGRDVAELSDSAGRDAAKEELTKQIEAAYGELVLGVFFTDFVTE